MEKFNYGKAVCYSGFRENQSPHTGVYPSYEQVKEDLQILVKDFKYIRMYTPSKHAEVTLKVIKDLNLDLKVMLGVDLFGEVDNKECTWGGRQTPESIEKHKQLNKENFDKLILLANRYPEIIFSVSAGNEAVPEWNGNLVSPEKVLEYVKYLKQNCAQPVTYCEGGNYWTSILKEVAQEVDFLSVHTYPTWNGFTIDEGLKTAKKDFQEVLDMYPDKLCVITETGWPSSSDGKRMKIEYVGEEIEERYTKEINEWSKEIDTLMFLFEAFDEPWKGGGESTEPEKNWGLYFVNRTPKKAMK